MSEATRAKFVVDQDQYFKRIGMNEDQRRKYQMITIRYEKKFMNIYRSQVGASLKKKEVKKALKAKNNEMRAFLGSGQYKIYLKRQKVIATNYNE